MHDQKNIFCCKIIMDVVRVLLRQIAGLALSQTIFSSTNRVHTQTVDDKGYPDDCIRHFVFANFKGDGVRAYKNNYLL